MKKIFTFVLVLVTCIGTTMAETIVTGDGTISSYEGTDFWVTLMRSDSRLYDELSVAICTNETANVMLENPYTGFRSMMQLAPNQAKYVTLMEADCYVTDEFAEQVCGRAIHVVSDQPVSLLAADYKSKSFDVSSVLPTDFLGSEYRIQCYTPSAHSELSQGSHFAVIAAEDNVVVDITPTVATSTGHQAGITYSTDTLRKGQVWYVWTGNGSGDNYDFSGTVVKARDNKKIAVFQGNSHTNIPTNVRDRDQLYSQAYPVESWGTRFAITSSLTTIANQQGYWERINKVRVQALVDETVIIIDGDTVHTFDFASNPKHYYEFDFGAKDSMIKCDGDRHRYFEGAAHYIETSCPCAVHLFSPSNRYDHDKISGVNTKYCEGDPFQMWIYPLDNASRYIQFSTFATPNTQAHFVNIITTTGNVNSVIMDSISIAQSFIPFPYNPDYSYARINVSEGNHWLSSRAGCVAYIYGMGSKESYGYSAGGAVKELTHGVYVDNILVTPGDGNLICSDATLSFACRLNYEYEEIEWYYGDGSMDIVTNTSAVQHEYAQGGCYHVTCVIHAKSDHLCIGQTTIDSITFPIFVIDPYSFSLDGAMIIPCPDKDAPVKGRIAYSSSINLTGDYVSVRFNEQAKEAGFKDNELIVHPHSFELTIPETAVSDSVYGILIHINSACGDTTVTLPFRLPANREMIVQNSDELVLTVQGGGLSDLQWYRASDSTAVEGQTSPILNRYNLPDAELEDEEYYICFTMNKQMPDETYSCSCVMGFDTSSSHEGWKDAQSNHNQCRIILRDGQIYILRGKKMYALTGQEVR